MLDVQKVRLRFISARLLASAMSIFKSAGHAYSQRTVGIRGCFLLAPCSFKTDKDVRGSKQKRCFCDAKTRVRKCTRAYTSGQAIFKSAGSVPPWMAVIPHRNEICEMQILQLKNIHGCIFFNVPAGVFCSRLVSSERPRMDGV